MGQVIMSGIVPKLRAPVPPPPPVTNFTVTGSGVSANLSWTNPTDEGFYQVIVTQKEGSAPTSPTDGEQIYVGTGTSATASGLSPSTTYYWAAFAMDAETRYMKDFPTGSYTTPASYDEVLFYNGTGVLGTAVVGSAYSIYQTRECQKGYYDGCHSSIYGGIGNDSGIQVLRCYAVCGECGCDVYGGSYSFTTGVDLTNVSKIVITARANIGGSSTNYDPQIAISKNKGNVGGTNFRTGIVMKKEFRSSAAYAEYTFDVSELSGLHYFGIVNGCGDYETANSVYISKIVATYTG